MKPRQIAAMAAVSAALASGVTAFAFDAGTPSAAAQTEFTVTAGQLRINQRISQAAVRRANALRTDVDAIRRALGQVPAPVSGATCDVASFSGNGIASIGTLARSCESVIEWTSAASELGLRHFSMSDDGIDLHVSSDAPSGSSVLPPGVYENVGITGSADWAITVRPR